MISLQVKFVNNKIASTRSGVQLHGLRLIWGLSDSFIEVQITSLEWNIMQFQFEVIVSSRKLLQTFSVELLALLTLTFRKRLVELKDKFEKSSAFLSFFGTWFEMCCHIWFHLWLANVNCPNSLFCWLYTSSLTGTLSHTVVHETRKVHQQQERLALHLGWHVLAGHL